MQHVFLSQAENSYSQFFNFSSLFYKYHIYKITKIRNTLKNINLFVNKLSRKKVSI